MPQTTFRVPLLLPLLATLVGCAPSDRAAPTPAASARRSVSAVPEAATREIEALRGEVARLRAENAQLRLTPVALAVEVDAAVGHGDLDKAHSALRLLIDKFPHSAQAGEGRRKVEALEAKLRAAAEEARRLAALGFRALKANSAFEHDGTMIGVGDASIGRRWTFDHYGDGWRFLDAEKDKKFLVTRVTVSAKSKDPALFGIAAYVADGATLVQLGKVRYRFLRWRDFGAFLGTHADFRNDFSRASRIPFLAAVAVDEDQLKRRPLYLVATREGCHRRQYERFGQPPVFYVPGPCASLKPTLTIEDFKDGSLAVLRRID